MKPTVLVENLTRSFRVFVIAEEHSWTPDTHFSTRFWNSLFVPIIVGVAHLWYILQLELHVALHYRKVYCWTTNMPGCRVIGVSHKTCSRAFRKPVALKYWTNCSHFHKGVNVR